MQADASTTAADAWEAVHEVHAVDPDKEGERGEDGGEDREDQKHPQLAMSGSAQDAARRSFQSTIRERAGPSLEAKSSGNSRNFDPASSLKPKQIPDLFQKKRRHKSSPGEAQPHACCLHFSMCARHPCARAMLIFSVPFQF